MRGSLGFFSCFLCALFVATPAFAEVFEASPGDDIESMIAALTPGDEIVLASGDYLVTERFTIELAGTEAAPIIIRAADGARPHIHRGDASQNIVDIISAQWVVLRGIEFSGGSAGVRVQAAQDLVIEDCEIHDTADVALRMNDGGARYERITIRRNHIHDTNGTGEGMYLGCNNNGCQLANSRIEGNWIHHTNNPATISQGDGIEIKEGSFGNVIVDNVIHDTNYPCILTYSTAGNGAANIIERNVMWNCGDHGIQSAADVTIRNNIILSAVASGIAAQPHQSGSPSNMRIVNNTIVTPGGDAISVRGPSGAVIVANNAVFSESARAIFVNGDTSLVTLANNFGIGDGAASASLTDFESASFAGAPPMNLFPSAGSALIAAGDGSYLPADDFNGLSRSAADVGAYAFTSAGNPGWMLGEGFKGETTIPGGDAGPDAGADAGVTDAGPDSGSSSDVGTDAPRSDSGGTDSGGSDGGSDGDDGGCQAGGNLSGQTSLLALLLILWAGRLSRRRTPHNN